MIAREVNVLLTEAALRDPRMKRTDPVEQADMATVWAEDLADVSLEDARAAVKAHYATSREPVMIADILARCGVVEDPWAHLPDDSEAIYAASKKAALEKAGVSDEEWEANRGSAAWVREHFPEIELQPWQARMLDASPKEREGWL